MSYQDGICEVKNCRTPLEIIDETTGTTICLCDKHSEELDDTNILFINKRTGVMMIREGKPALLKIPTRV